MSPDTFKILTVSLTSSLCTALLIVAGTAVAENTTAEPAPSPPDNASGDDSGGGEDQGEATGDGGEDGDGVSAKDLAAMKADIASIRCFFGHMTDDQNWVERPVSSVAHPGYWTDIDDDSKSGWDQGPNSDAKKAYEACF